MLVNASNLNLIFVGFKTAFNIGIAAAPATWNKVAMKVISGSREENYGWLGALPRIREWVGDRVVHNLTLHSYAIKNRTFEQTIGVDREDIEDDRHGVMAPLFAQMGRDAALHPEEIVYALLAAGFTTACFDNQYFFDTDHPVIGADGNVQSVSNMQAGAEPAWYLLDTSQAIRPLIFQERRPYQFVRKDKPDDDNVFSQNKFLYGVDARCNVGFGLWQLAFASKADLTPANYAAARAAMMAFKGDNGKPLGIVPNTLVIPPTLESKGRKLVINTTGDAGAANEWAGTAELVMARYLA